MGKVAMLPHHQAMPLHQPGLPLPWLASEEFPLSNTKAGRETRELTHLRIWAMDDYGWLRMTMEGYGWLWMAIDGDGWLWMAVDGYGEFPEIFQVSSFPFYHGIKYGSKLSHCLYKSAGWAKMVRWWPCECTNHGRDINKGCKSWMMLDAHSSWCIRESIAGYYP